MKKNRLKRGRVLSTIILFAVLISSGCISDINPSKNQRDSLIWGVYYVEAIYPTEITNDNYFTIIPNIFNGLVEFDQNYRIIPVLALSWSNPDNVTWRFSLRHGVKFHNGDDFTAWDAKYTFDNVLTSYQTIKTIIENTTVLDNYTIDVKTTVPTPDLLSLLANYAIMCCKNSTEEHGLIGTGPYRIGEYSMGNFTTLERFDQYWGEPPEVKTVTFRQIEDAESRLNALLSGEIDLAEYNIDDKYEQISQNKDIVVTIYPPLSTYIIGFDMRENGSYAYPDGRNPTADVRVRRAIYQGINITPLINGPFQGLAHPASQFLTPNIFGYDPEIQRLPYNVTAARQLLEEAGYGAGLNITFDCITQGFEYNAENCYLITQQLSELGIHVTMNNLSMTEFNDKVYYQKNTSMYLVGNLISSIDGGLEYNNYLRTFDGSIGFCNAGHYSNPEVDRLGIQASQEMDSQARLQLLQEGFRIAIEDDVVFIPLFSQDLFTLTSKNIDYPARADSRMVVKDIKFI
jgi:peptide/nickel transport system substrate-binding protein